MVVSADVWVKSTTEKVRLPQGGWGCITNVTTFYPLYTKTTTND